MNWMNHLLEPISSTLLKQVNTQIWNQIIVERLVCTATSHYSLLSKLNFDTDLTCINGSHCISAPAWPLCSTLAFTTCARPYVHMEVQRWKSWPFRYSCLTYWIMESCLWSACGQSQWHTGTSTHMHAHTAGFTHTRIHIHPCTYTTWSAAQMSSGKTSSCRRKNGP